MASTIDIEVNLNSKNALKGLDKLEGAGEAVGESFNSMGQAVGKMGGEMNEQLGALGESAGALSGSFQDLGSAAMAPGASFTALLGPIGAVIIGIIELSKAFDEYTGKAQEAEIRVESYRAATAELTSVVEELAAAQVKLNEAQIRELKTASMRAKIPLERAQMIREANATREEEIHILKQRLKVERQVAKANAVIASGYVTASQESSRALSIREKIAKKQKKINQEEERAIKLTIKGAQETVKLEKKKEDLLKQSPEFLEDLKERELRIQEQAQINSLESAKDTAKAQIEIAKIQSRQKIREIKKLEDISDGLRYQAITSEQERREAQISEIEQSFANKRASARSARRRKQLTDQKIANAKREMLERQTQNEMFNIRALQIQQMKQAGATELQILESKHQLARDRARKNQALLLAADIRFEMAKTELVKAEEAEREKVRLKAFEESQAALTQLRNSVQDQINQAGDFAAAFGGAFAEASYGALAMGESFTDSISKIIHGLGQQASVEALIESAKAFASLAIGDFTGAAAHGKAAAGFAAGAIAAGVAGNALSSGGSSGGSGGDVSPSGASQVAPSHQRERAEESQTVFNVNFGGAVIYDTKQAAERALVDRIVDVMNQQNRGSRRLNLRRS